METKEPINNGENNNIQRIYFIYEKTGVKDLNEVSSCIKHLYNNEIPAEISPYIGIGGKKGEEKVRIYIQNIDLFNKLFNPFLTQIQEYVFKVGKNEEYRKSNKPNNYFKLPFYYELKSRSIPKDNEIQP